MRVNEQKFVTQLSWTPEMMLGAETSHRFPSVCRPDTDAYSIAELLERHMAGLLTDVELARPTQYSEDPSFDDVDMEKQMYKDPVEQEEFVAAGKQYVDNFKASEKERLAKEESTKRAAEIEAAVQERLKKERENPVP